MLRYPRRGSYSRRMVVIIFAPLTLVHVLVAIYVRFMLAVVGAVFMKSRSSNILDVPLVCGTLLPSSPTHFLKLYSSVHGLPPFLYVLTTISRRLYPAPRHRVYRGSVKFLDHQVHCLKNRQVITYATIRSHSSASWAWAF